MTWLCRREFPRNSLETSRAELRVAARHARRPHCGVVRKLHIGCPSEPRSGLVSLRDAFFGGCAILELVRRR